MEFKKPVITTRDPETLILIINQLSEQNFYLTRLVEEKDNIIDIQKDTIHILEMMQNLSKGKF